MNSSHFAAHDHCPDSLTHLFSMKRHPGLPLFSLLLGLPGALTLRVDVCVCGFGTAMPPRPEARATCVRSIFVGSWFPLVLTFSRFPDLSCGPQAPKAAVQVCRRSLFNQVSLQKVKSCNESIHPSICLPISRPVCLYIHQVS